jgi:flagellar FliL protein
MILIAILASITLILTAAFAMIYFLNREPGQSKPLSAAQIKENTVDMKDITTNLSGDKYIKISFAFVLENRKAKEEFEQLDFKVKDVIIKTLMDLKPEQIEGSKGQENLTSLLQDKINNGILTQGKLKQIYITDRVIQ